MSDEVPEQAKIWFDDDVASWLHELADRDFDGDVQEALNATLRAVMAAEQAPTDPWTLLRDRTAARKR